MASDAQTRQIRRARADEREAVAACVAAAYAKYVPRMGKQPAPMLADYGALITRGVVHVIAEADTVRGVVVLFPQDGAMFLENVAVHPHDQGAGLGRALMAFVEEQARAAGLPEVRLYTHETMTENVAYYGHLGYAEIERRVEDGYARVFMRKSLR